MKLSTTKVVLLLLTIMCLVITKVSAKNEKRHHCDDDDDEDCDWDRDNYYDRDDDDYDNDDWEHGGRTRGYPPGVVPGMPGNRGEPLAYRGPDGRETAVVYPTSGTPGYVTATYSQVGSSTYYPQTGQVIRNAGSRESSSASISALAITAAIAMALNV